MRDFLKGLDLDKDKIDSIMAEYGKRTNTDKDKISELEEKLKTANADIESYKAKISELTDETKDSAKIKEELETLKNSIAEKEAEAKAKKDDEILTNNIISAFGDKKFVNEYTKNAIIADIKKGLKEEANSGKSAKDLFEEYTKDKSDIFANPNQIKNMPGMGDGEQKENNKEMPMIW